MSLSSTIASFHTSATYSANSCSLSNSQDNEERQPIISTQTSSTYTRAKKLTLASCLTAIFLSNVCASLPAPFLPSLNEDHNLGSDITGFVIGLLSLTEIFVCPLYGKLMPHIAVKTMLVTGLFVTGTFTVLFGLLDYLPQHTATDDSMDILFLVMEITVRILQSLGAGAIIVSAMTLLTVTFTENTTTIISYSQTMIGLGYMCGPALGSGLYRIGGFSAVFCILGAFILIVSFAVCYFLPMDDGVRSADSDSSFRQVLTKRIVAVLSLTVFIGTLWSSIEPVIEPELREKFGLTEDISALTFLIASATYTVSSITCGKALDKYSWINAKHLMIAGFLLTAVNYLLMGPCPLFGDFYRPLWLLLLCLGILGFANAMAVMPTFDLISFNGSSDASGNVVQMDKSAKAMVSALWTTAYSLGDFLGPTFSGVMTAKTSFGWTMSSYSFACMLAVILLSAEQIYRYIASARNSNNTEPDETVPLVAEI